MPLEHHVFSASGKLPPFNTERRVLLAVRNLLRLGGDAVALFCVVPSHVHVLLDAEQPGLVAGSLLRSFRAAGAESFTPAHCTPVENKGHLLWLARDYLVTQPERHDLPGHPALWPGSCFLDLVGARRVPGFTLALLRILPSYKVRTAHDALHLPHEPLRPCSLPALRDAGPHRIMAAAGAAVALPMPLGRGRLETQARQTAAALCDQAEFSTRSIAQALGVQVASARRLVRKGAPPRLCQAVRKRIQLENWVIASGLPHPR
jgi:hypothetical protein